MKDDILIGDTPKARRRRRRLEGVEADGRLWKHASLADINGLVSPDFVRSAFCFTLVRNPWDRMVSYYHWLRAQRFAHPAVARAKAVGFSEFLSSTDIQASIQAANYASYMQAADGRECAQLFIRLEHFDEDASALWEHLGFHLELPHKNRSERGHDYRGYYTSSDAELLSQLCHKDVQRFDYRF